ncbi:hypothetical protein BUALT_Bualt14G0021400 [Buddleja alternifolia]|uniref:Uncharacterized protein n=1 Tax=Buddleja alternifolia TaxID=168488 RepID=A0AAV6WH43_9LAMI|nr:hypothetical protein BUALT_Bualt14G0021400 [Buddleja alternifolia]
MCPQQCCHGTDERTEKSQLTELISGLGVQDLAPMSVSLSHSLSRYKLKFSPDKIEMASLLEHHLKHLRGVSLTVPYDLSLEGGNEPWAKSFLAQMQSRWEKCKRVWGSLHMEFYHKIHSPPLMDYQICGHLIGMELDNGKNSMRYLQSRAINPVISDEELDLHVTNLDDVSLVPNAHNLVSSKLGVGPHRQTKVGVVGKQRAALLGHFHRIQMR